jgi:hypothetical protein
MMLLGKAKATSLLMRLQLIFEEIIEACHA